MTTIKNNTVVFPMGEVVSNVPTKQTGKKRKLRPWVKVAGSMLLGGVITMASVFHLEQTSYIEVEVEAGDTVCSIIEEYNTIKTCGDLKKDVYNSNGMFYGKSREGLSDIRIGDVLTIPVVEKRFVK